MKIYAVVTNYDDGVWLEEDSPEHFLYATLELAEESKFCKDAEDILAHDAREVKRYERWARMNAAKAILEHCNFEGIEDALPYSGNPFSPYEFKPQTRIIALEVHE